ncbi:MAG: T9SS type A sorting domain-containing protein [Psychroserpens sp.]|uniref:T9SS type A sorting domain-containing protein n=1 Tax=Psychroserpens sp. TaxID=2020870 RepID=UPI003C9A8F3C
MKHYYLLLAFVMSICTAWSQDYRQMIAAGTYTVAEIQAVAEAHFAEVGTGRGNGYKPYKRWEYQALRNVDETGMLKSPEFYYQELQNYNEYINENFPLARTTVGAWEQMGPDSWNATSGWNPGVGRITSIAVEETNDNHMIVGGETGGVWRSLDAGSTWTVLTDDLSNLNVYALTIDPVVNTTYYWGSTSGTIFKSTDSGATWNVLNDLGPGNVNKILVDPTNTNKLYCSIENGGIFKSIDGGVTWNRISPMASNGYDIEFKPDGLYNTIYASGNGVFISTNSGATFTQLSGFFSGPKMIGTTSDDPEILYVLEASDGAFGNLYKSIDSGISFTVLDHLGKNYFGYSSDPLDVQDAGLGQAPRDMDIAISPTDALDVHIAGINTWRSTDGGVNFSITSQWTPGGADQQNIGYCHADVDLIMFVNDKLYAGTDGGIFVAETPTVVNSQYYRDLTVGLGVRQFYKIGISQTNPVIVTGGSQDNGTSIMDANGDWTDWLGADGMECFIDKNDSNIVYGTSQFGNLYKSVNSGQFLTAITTPASGNWITPFEQDPNNPNTLYTGYRNVYKSINGGTSWETVSQDFGGNLNHLKVSDVNGNIQYAARGSNLYKNNFVGVIDNWNQLSGFSGSINSIAIHPSNPNKVAIATTGNQKVYVTTNGGTSWASYKFNLPNFSAQALVWHDNGNDGLYLGMNYGVYYIDNTFTEWQPFSNNLPNVIISELEINYEDNKLYAGTYGRGLWRTNVFDETLSVADLEINSIAMYPNPASKEVILSWDKSSEVSIRIYDALGKLMYFSRNDNLIDPKRIDVSNYTTGLYFVKINNNNGVVTKKLSVK